MATAPERRSVASQARRLFVDDLLGGMATLVAIVNAAASARIDDAQAHRPGYRQRREDAQFMLNRYGSAWHQALIDAFSTALRPGSSLMMRAGTSGGGLTLVDNKAIEFEILASKMASAIIDKTQWEYADIRARIASLESRDDLEKHDIMRAQNVARVAAEAWGTAGLDKPTWTEVEPVLLREFSVLVLEAYHEVNRFLLEKRILPSVDLRPLVRRSRQSLETTLDAGPGATGHAGSRGDGATGMRGDGGPATSYDRGSPNTSFGRGGSEETRLMTRAAAIQRLADNAEVVISKLNSLVAKQVPNFVATQVMGQPREVSPRLKEAIGEAQQQPLPSNADGGIAATPALIEALNQRKAALKESATTQVERATIEIVALMFQAILTEERLPPAVRVWFARLQMPVLRVAVGEPDFFAATDHPARRLIDRMGACVMGFSPASAASIGDALDREIKRIVQVIEAYPDTGRRVFSTVLVEFERFLEHYFKSENEASKKGVSLAQQVEQRETLAIQYTIELRKMLEEVPVQEGIRSFLFHVWADVLALSAVKHGPQSEPTRAMRLAAADLVWSAGAKVSREERAEVIRRLPPLLKTLRDGMASAGHSVDKQDQHIQALNESLAAAFSARAAAIPAARFDELRENLETLEELLPDATDVELDHTLMLDLSGQDSSDLEVVQEGGSMPTPAMLQWARELQVGSWYMLDYNGRNEPVQLAWTGLRRHLSLFVSAGGRCVLFQQPRLAAFLQAGLLVPAQEESLTTKATRAAMEKIDADPQRLLA
jgi:hypothetical protein